MPVLGPGASEFQWPDFFKTYEANRLLYSDCLDWSLGFWNERSRDNICLLFYEDFITDLPTQTRKIAKFLGKEISSTRMDRIAKEANLSTMAGNAATNGQHLGIKTGFKFVNTGKVGVWKDYFTVALFNPSDRECY